MNRAMSALAMMGIVGAACGAAWLLLGSPAADAAPSVVLPTDTPTTTPVPSQYLAVDCDVATSGVQSNCSYDLASTSSIEVGLVFVNVSLSPTYRLGAFDLALQDDDVSRLDPPAIASVPPSLGANPDFDEAVVVGTWDCAQHAPDNDTGEAGAGKAASSIDCQDNLPFDDGPLFSVGAQLTLATVHYDIPPGASPGSVPLHPIRANIVASDTTLLGVCPEMPCLGATVNLFNQPTPTPTATPEGPAVVKVPEGNPNSVDPSIPAGNLWLCYAGPCDGPGEGDLIVVEHAFNVHTGDLNNDGYEDGLGAYEFQVEYDNLVIQSVNPSDIVFSPGGAGEDRGLPVCTFSLVLENVVRFGCVTSGPLPPGPTGDFDLAQLDLIPHPDLVNDIFPGNDNGVPTVLKDNGCELADVFGHPVLGSINGGLTPLCGDLAVTVRILEGDLNLDCRVDVVDEQLIAMHYAAVFGGAYYSKWFDLEPATHDLDIDIKDLQKVFGRDGSTCQEPIPAQPPLPPPFPFPN